MNELEAKRQRCDEFETGIALLQRILSQLSVISANRREKNHLNQQLTQQTAILFLIEIS